MEVVLVVVKRVVVLKRDGVGGDILFLVRQAGVSVVAVMMNRLSEEDPACSMSKEKEKRLELLLSIKGLRAQVECPLSPTVTRNSLVLSNRRLVLFDFGRLRKGAGHIIDLGGMRVVIGFSSG